MGLPVAMTAPWRSRYCGRLGPSGPRQYSLALFRKKAWICCGKIVIRYRINRIRNFGRNTRFRRPFFILHPSLHRRHACTPPPQPVWREPKFPARRFYREFRENRENRKRVTSDKKKADLSRARAHGMKNMPWLPSKRRTRSQLNRRGRGRSGGSSFL